jgi:2-phospho-L-lactate guanylyltransferase
MQGTVATFDPASRSTKVLLDDGTPIDVPVSAFDASGLRLLRFGQRVRLDLDADQRVVGVALVTM